MMQSTSTSWLPLKELLRFRAPERGALFGSFPRDETPWSGVLPAPPRIAAKEQELTPWQHGELHLAACT